VLAPLGYSRKMDVGATSGYGGDTPVYWIALAERPVPSDPESGLHFCFAAPTRQSAAFAVDPDGYRLEAYCSRADKTGRRSASLRKRPNCCAAANVRYAPILL
jgi:hypothetical protein